MSKTNKVIGILSCLLMLTAAVVCVYEIVSLHDLLRRSLFALLLILNIRSLATSGKVLAEAILHD